MLYPCCWGTPVGWPIQEVNWELVGDADPLTSGYRVNGLDECSRNGLLESSAGGEL